MASAVHVIVVRGGEEIDTGDVERVFRAACTDGELSGIVCDLLAFPVLHEAHGQALGIAVTCEPGRTVSLAQLRQAARRQKWCPELLLLLRTLPRGPGGESTAAGLAEALQLPPLTLKQPTRTIDMRASASLDGAADYESSQRAAARKAASMRKAARRKPKDTASITGVINPLPVDAADGSQSWSVDDFIQLVARTMAEVGGEDVSDSDDLFQVGLSSVTAARLRQALGERLGIAIPADLVYKYTAVPSLAAMLFRLCRMAAGESQSQSSPVAATVDMEHSVSLNVPQLITYATTSYRDGDVMETVHTCVTAARLSGLLNDGSHMVETLGSPSDISGYPRFVDVTKVELARPPILADAHYLLLLLSAVQRMQHWRKAALVCSQLLRLDRSVSGVDVALLWMMLARIYDALGDTEDSQDAANAASAAAMFVDGNCDAINADDEAPTVPTPGGTISEDTPWQQGCLRTGVCCALELATPIQSAIMDISDAWCTNCRALQTIVLSGQSLRELPSSIGDLSALRVLDASDNALTSLPSSLCRCRELREMILAANDLCDLPAWLPDLPNLHVLNLQRNRLRSLPVAVLRCTKLRYLRWGAQKVLGGTLMDETNKPDAQECFAGEPAAGEGFASPSLTVVELEANGVGALSRLHPRAMVLTAVLASYNLLGAVPVQLVDYGHTLKKLHLGCNGIVSVDEVIPSLGKVTELCLEGNRLTRLPESIGTLAKLKELWLHGNLLDELPAALGRCASLTVIQCHHNRLSELPEAMAQLRKLQGLYLQSNRLRGSLTTLRERILRHLPLQNLALGCNALDLSEAFGMDDVRIGLGWNRGEPPEALRGALTDRLGLVDHLFEPLCKDGRRADVLLVAFAAQGPGMLQWAVPCAAARAAGVSIDALYLADPSNSYYLQDPTGEWDGVSHFERIVREHADGYARVFMVGSSMGATAALMHAHLAHRCLAFGPRVDLRRTHGSYVPDCAKRACSDAVDRSLRGLGGASVAVHVGRQNAVDVMQADVVRGLEHVTVVEHETFHHNVPMYLEREGGLVPLLKSELLELLRPR